MESNEESYLPAIPREPLLMFKRNLKQAKNKMLYVIFTVFSAPYSIHSISLSETLILSGSLPLLGSPAIWTYHLM